MNITHILPLVLSNSTIQFISRTTSLYNGRVASAWLEESKGPNRHWTQENLQFQYVCNNHVIKSADHVKYLGVIIDNSLSGDYIVDSIAQKVNSRLKFLYRQARLLDLKCKMSLCSSLIQCHIDYASSAWYSGRSKSFKQKLQICHNKMVRFICGFSSRNSVDYTIRT